MIDVDLMVPDEKKIALLKRQMKRGMILQEDYDRAFGLLEAWRPLLQRRITLEEFETDRQITLDDENILKAVLTQNEGSELWYYGWDYGTCMRGKGIALIHRGKVIYVRLLFKS